MKEEYILKFIYGIPDIVIEPKFQLFEREPDRFYWGRNYTFLPGT